MNPSLEPMVFEALRILFLALIPIVIASAIGGIFSGVLQTVTSIHDPAVGFAGRWAALFVALYLVGPRLIEPITALCAMALR